MGSSASKKPSTAGAVVLRGEPATPDVLMVQHGVGGPWRLPRQRVGPDEYVAASAARAARTDAQMGIRLGLAIAASTAGHDARPVAWWRARATRVGTRWFDAEIVGVAWLPADEAAARAVGTGDELLIRRAVGLADTVPILIVRHGKAMARSDWSGRDQARPLTARGRRQAAALTPLLVAYGVTRVASSTSTRCVKTLAPYATAEHLEIEGWSTLSEEQAKLSLKAVDKLMRRLIEQTLETGQPLAICGHRPVLPTMLAALGIPARQLTPGACVVAHLGPGGHRLGFEHHPSKL